ncbi:MAG: type II toxin-antitoxin system PemK/MazF family toxin [Acidobacteriota bacterium]
MEVVARRFDIFLVNLDPTAGHGICKTRPCVVISPDEVNRHLQALVVAPLTTVGRSYPTRVDCTFQGKKGQVVLDQIRTIDRIRLVKRLGRLSPSAAASVLSVLSEMFAE